MPQEQKDNERQSQPENKFWNFVPGTATTAPELLLYGPIASSQSWWEDRVTPAAFNKELAELGDVPEIVVRINSGGGDVFAANAIFTRLKDHPAKITVKVDGWAASAATIIAMAGDTIKIARNGVFMIHDPSMTVWDSYTAEEFDKLAAELRVIKNSIVNTYAMKTGKDSEEISKMMAEERWWTGDEAVSEGFCDELLFEAVNTVIENQKKIVVNSIPIDISRYKTSPNIQNLVIASRKNDVTAEKKEEKTVEPKDITTVEALRNAFPDLVAAIENNAKSEERQRIKDIKDTVPAGYEDIVEDAMFENPVAAEKVAVKILAKQKEQGAAYLNSRENDVKDGNVGNVGASAKEAGGEPEDPFRAAIDKLPDLLKLNRRYEEWHSMELKKERIHL